MPFTLEIDFLALHSFLVFIMSFFKLPLRPPLTLSQSGGGITDSVHVYGSGGVFYG